ncbi:MAG: thiamine-phosphate kinase [Oscillatoriales cyanobacterium]|nr:MAG: thiamine-phosphate kinase [Oscillatoriales cyanobacterium]
MLVQDLGESGVLHLVQRFCPPEVVGNDAAVCAVRAGYALAVTADMLVDDVHFSDRTTSAYDVGWRSIAANLSDLAAMAATPIGVTISLGLPPTTPVSWLEGLYSGVVDCLQVGGFDVPIVGGDVCSSRVRTVSIAAFGEVKPGAEIRRDRARAGDVIVMTGLHGLSRMGLGLLLEPDREEWRSIAVVDRERAIAAHQRPQPRLDLVRPLQAWQENRQDSSRIAGMDSSDGLADAIVQICHASRCGAIVWREALGSLADLGLPASLALDWTLYGGEDFELVLCLPEPLAQELVQLAGHGAAIIGEITESPEITVLSRDHTDLVRLDRRQGFQHFSAP